MLGICYGAQEIVNHFGGLVERAAKREFGFAELVLANEQPGAAHLFTGVPETSRVYQQPPLPIFYSPTHNHHNHHPACALAGNLLQAT